MERVSAEPQFSFLDQAKKLFFIFAGFFVFFFSILVVLQIINFAGQAVTFILQDTSLVASLAPSALPPDSALAAANQAAINFVPVAKADSLTIAKLGLDAPLVKARSTDLKIISQDLDRGTVIYPGSALPGQAGQLLVLGHSAPAFWPKIRYDTVFSKLNDLEAGDEILVTLDQKQYRYQVTKKIFLEKGAPIPQSESADPHQLYLITCWPPGRDLKRLAVEAVLL